MPEEESKDWEASVIEKLITGFGTIKLMPMHVLAFRRGQSLGIASKGPSYDSYGS